MRLLILVLLAMPLAAATPNFVVILADNLGYGDVGCFGSTLHRTPNVDRMATEGMRLTSFYVSSGVCTPSRASLMTGCYPRRVGLHYNDRDLHVLRPMSPHGLHPDEETIAEVLQRAGYATAIIGKWHLGDQPEFLPTRQGFDFYFGIPYSDDMSGGKSLPGESLTWPPLPLMRNELVIEAPADRTLLTRRYTEQAIEFITEHRDEPFFVYLPHAMPGSTQAPFSSERFRGQSANGPWGDSVEELDWSTGEILGALKRLNLDENTLVIWTSDNGAPRRNPPQGNNKPLGGWGYTTAEGGQRVPCVVRWPGRIPAGEVRDTITTSMDLLPTFAQLAGADLPERVIDGTDIWPVLAGESREAVHEAFYYYFGPQLQAVRSGRWKLALPLEEKWVSFRGKTEPSAGALYDVVADPGETEDVASEEAEAVRRLTGLAEEARAELGDVGRTGAGQRALGRVGEVGPRVK